MKFNLESNDYAKIAVGLTAIVFIISAVLACSWWNENGFDINTIVAMVCTAVCMVILIVSVWFMARTTRAKRMEDDEIVLKYVPGNENRPKEPEKPKTVFKKPKD